MIEGNKPFLVKANTDNVKVFNKVVIVSFT
jgi:hypothetical protein